MDVIKTEINFKFLYRMLAGVYTLNGHAITPQLRSSSYTGTVLATGPFIYLNFTEYGQYLAIKLPGDILFQNVSLINGVSYYITFTAPNAPSYSPYGTQTLLAYTQCLATSTTSSELVAVSYPQNLLGVI